VVEAQVILSAAPALDAITSDIATPNIPKLIIIRYDFIDPPVI
jgi:hypothetical protein